MEKIILKTDKKPKGDQPKAIAQIVANFKKGIKRQLLLGATGTGKTFTMANVIAQLNTKTLILAPNKTLAAQLYMEIKALFPLNKVEYFVSYFDFFQPEAYVVKTDKYIEKSSKTNVDIEMLRLSSLTSLSCRDDVIVVGSVAAIYASSNPNDFKENKIILDINEKIKLSEIKNKLVMLNYERNDIDLKIGGFRLKGDVLEISPGYDDEIIYQISFFGDQIETINILTALERKKIKSVDRLIIHCAKEYVVNHNSLAQSISRIKEELKQRIDFFKNDNKLIEAKRIEQRTNHDLESLAEFGYCNGVENYAFHLELRQKDQPPYTILDYFGSDWLIILDESHMMVPQIIGMHNTDYSRKKNLVDYGFRLPSALDNRPLNFEEFNTKLDKVLYVSATPGDYEKALCKTYTEQIVRPTGLLDPIIEIYPTKNQIIKILDLIKQAVQANERCLITVLTIKMAEELANYLNNNNVKAHFLHNEIKTIERIKILNNLRSGVYDVVIGINLLREGLDLPEVSKVIIIDADKPGLYRNERALIQTIGRAARNCHGTVYMFGHIITKEMQNAIDETERRRKIQQLYNIEHNITPKTIIKPISDEITKLDSSVKITKNYDKDYQKIIKNKNNMQVIIKLKKQMKQAAANEEYERAAYLRDLIIELQNK